MKRIALLWINAVALTLRLLFPVAATDLPRLSIEKSSSQIQLGWTNAATGFTLEERPNFLPSSIWVPSAERVNVNAGEFQVSASLDRTSRFFRLRLIAESEPPDLTSAATPPPKGISTRVGESTQFLYSGTNAVQVGVASNTIEMRRAGVIRGRVKNRDGSALPDVTVSVMSHPEFGVTTSRTNGNYDLAVNGGGPLTINLGKAGYCPVHRELQVPWQGYVIAPDVMLVQMDPVVTAVTLGSNSPFQVAESSMQNDRDGTRHTLLLFNPGTTAGLVMPDGSTQPAGSLHIRATEFTVGTNGAAAMPAFLPPLSAYTYCVELSADEASTVGALGVVFNQPVTTYTENFLKFPVGVTVPVGIYDRARAVWLASQNGRVVQIIGITAGAADVDTDGDGIADGGLGLTPDERKALAATYIPGQSLWRVAVSHFSPEDSNWPYTTPSDATGPGKSGAGPDPNEPLQDPCKSSGSIIECENQVLGDAISIVGTPYTLNYRSDRVPGRVATRNIHVSGPSLPASLQSISMHLFVAGRSFDYDFPATPNQEMTFTWDRKDGYGRTVLGAQDLNITIDYNYPTMYRDPGDFPSAFNQTGGTTLGVNSSRQTIRISDRYTVTIGEGLTDARTIGLGGWTLNAHQVFDPAGRVMHAGDGGRRRAASIGHTLTTIDLPGQRIMTGVAAAADGTLYVASPKTDVVIRIAPDGTQSVFAGTGIEGFSGDGGPANQAQLGDPFGIRLGPDGSLYIAEESNNRIRRVAPDGTITTVAGTGSATVGGDGGQATSAGLFHPDGLAVGSDSSLYVVSANSRIRRITADGIITTVAGNGSSRFGGDGGPATKASISALGVGVARDGTIYIADYLNDRVRRVGLDGIINTVADYTSEGGHPISVSFDSTGNLLIAVKYDTARSPQVDLMKSDGTRTTIAGGGSDTVRDGIPATQVNLVGIGDMITAPDGNIYIARFDNSSLVLRVGPALGGTIAGKNVVANPSGTQVFVFDEDGRHLQTLDALTGAVLLTFDYDSSGLLSHVIEKTGGTDNITTIEHDAAGNPTSIVGPYGQRTLLVVDAQGFLARVTNPAGEQENFGYTADGLLTSYANGLGHASNYAYDANGLLIQDADAGGGVQTLSRSTFTNSFAVTRTTALNRVTTYTQEALDGGLQRHTVTGPDGSVQQTTNNLDAGTSHVNSSDGSVANVIVGPDPRFGIEVPIQTSLSIQMPSGLLFTSGSSRSAVFNTNDPLSLVSLTQSTTVDGQTTTNVYTGADHTVVDISPTGRKHTSTLDALGRLATSQVDGLASTSAAYDGHGRLASLTTGTGADARIFSFTYTAAGFLGQVNDPLGRTARFEYDAAGRLTTKTIADGHATAFSYNAGGNLVSVTPPGRPAHTFGYSDRNDLTLITPPAGSNSGPTAIAYDADRALTNINRAASQTIDIQYDAAGRRTARTGSGAGGQDRFTYDNAGRLTNAVTSSGLTVSYSFDGSLLVGEAVSGPFTGKITHTFDTALRPASESINGSDTVELHYDADGLLTGSGQLTINADPRNGLSLGTTCGVVTDSLSYNQFGEVTNYGVRAGNNAIYLVGFGRDTIGRITKKVETVENTTQTLVYSYDLAGELTNVTQNGVTTESFTYDSNGNRISASLNGASADAAYDDQDRLISSGNILFFYNPAGDLIKKVAGSQTTTYSYDAFGNLRSVHRPDGTTIDYLIDASNRRFGKLVNGTLASGFLYGGASRPVAELDQTKAVVSRFVYANRAVPSYFTKGGASFRIITDPAGSIRLVINTVTGQVVQRLEYDSFGNVLLDTQPGFQPFGFAGGLYDRDTGLVRFGARDYDPASGRWTARDPLGFSGGDANLYRYVRNDPVNFSDPLGLTAEDIADEIGFLEEALANIKNKIVSVEVEGVPAIVNLDEETAALIRVYEPRLSQLKAIQKVFNTSQAFASKLEGPLAVLGAAADFGRLASHLGCPGFYDEELTVVGRRNPFLFVPAMNLRLGEGLVNGEIQSPSDFLNVWWGFANPF